MNKVVLGTVCFVSGTALGIAIGYGVAKKKQKSDIQYVDPIPVELPKKEEKKSREEKLEEMIQESVGEGSTYNEIFKSKPAIIARKPGDKGINYSKYVSDLKYKQETQVPPEGDEESDIPEEGEEDMSEYEETYEERLERENNEMVEQMEEYKNAHKGRIELMQSDEWDTDFRENEYERADLYYFTGSDILTDEDGHQLNEEEYIGKKVRQVGWMQSPDEIIYVRNHPKEHEYRIFKEHCTVEEWF